MKINQDRPVEELVGANRSIAQERLGNIHCMSKPFVAARAARPKHMRTVPVPLRRGWVKCVLDTMRSYRETYVAVMTGNFSHKEPE